jgi:hypothetical protein
MWEKLSFVEIGGVIIASLVIVSAIVLLTGCPIDYMLLLITRRFMVWVRRDPRAAVLLIPLNAFCIFMLVNVAFGTYYSFLFLMEHPDSTAETFLLRFLAEIIVNESTFTLDSLGTAVILFYPASVVAIWLILYLLSAALIASAYSLNVGVQTIRTYSNNPLMAIGFVAGVLVALSYWIVAFVIYCESR